MPTEISRPSKMVGVVIRNKIIDMKKHTEIYMDYFGYDKTDFIPCEVCESQSVDIHHIKPRGMGGSKTKDVIENLQALCRPCHIKFGDKKHHMDFLIITHQLKINK